MNSLALNKLPFSPVAELNLKYSDQCCLLFKWRASRYANTCTQWTLSFPQWTSSLCTLFSGFILMNVICICYCVIDYRLRYGIYRVWLLHSRMQMLFFRYILSPNLEFNLFVNYVYFNYCGQFLEFSLKWMIMDFSRYHRPHWLTLKSLCLL